MYIYTHICNIVLWYCRICNIVNVYIVNVCVCVCVCAGTCTCTCMCTCMYSMCACVCVGARERISIYEIVYVYFYGYVYKCKCLYMVWLRKRARMYICKYLQVHKYIPPALANLCLLEKKEGMLVIVIPGCDKASWYLSLNPVECVHNT